MDLSGLGKLLLVLAGVLAVLGLLLVLVGRGLIPHPGLPGDFSFGGRTWRVYVPLGTSIVLSVLLTIGLNLFFRR
ncbi:MAG: DUF2905 domain-containing protein [Actinobacteria bacterium]|nr:MAG: DUF2905 domain-containing protein [Actinomycetota bacterium]